MTFRKPGLVVQILIAIGLGALFGAVLPAAGIRALNTFRDFFSHLVKFLVPFIIIGLVTPAIAETGKSAGKLLVATLVLAYVSTIFAGYFAFFSGRAILPTLLGTGLDAHALAHAKSFPSYFCIPIPPIADVVTCLCIAFMIGLGIPVCRADAVFTFFTQLRDIVMWTIKVAFVPLLPFYILTVIADLCASGKLSIMAGPCIKLMIWCTLITWAILLIQYGVVCLWAKRNPFKALATMLPAYFTGFGCCSSAATIPVTMRQTLKNGVHSDVAGLVVPLCANVHLAGSEANMVGYAMGVALLTGDPISFVAFTQFILMVSIIAVASPGVPGGVVLASAAIAEAALGFSAERYAIVITIYMALDGMGTACNLTGDGAIAIAVDRFRSLFCKNTDSEH